MDKLPYAALASLGMALAYPLIQFGFKPIEVAAIGVLGFALIMGFFGAYFAGRAAERKAHNGTAQHA